MALVAPGEGPFRQAWLSAPHALSPAERGQGLTRHSWPPAQHLPVRFCRRPGPRQSVGDFFVLMYARSKLPYVTGRDFWICG